MGGAEITVTGSGFEPQGTSQVTVCDVKCMTVSSSSTSITCKAPPGQGI